MVIILAKRLIGPQIKKRYVMYTGAQESLDRYEFRVTGVFRTDVKSVQKHARFNGECPNGIGLPPCSHNLEMFVGNITAKHKRCCVRSHWRLVLHAQALRSSRYYFPHADASRASIQRTDFEAKFLNHLQQSFGVIARAMRKVANDPPVTRVRRAAI
jgi:hypothetical protein